jgi:hypothetical protein
MCAALAVLLILSGCSHLRPCSASCAEFFGDTYSTPTVNASDDAERDEYGQTKTQRRFGVWFTGFIVLLFALGLYYNGKGGGGTSNGNDAPPPVPCVDPFSPTCAP